MATKKTAAKTDDARKAAKAAPEPERESRIVQPGGIHADDLEVLAQPIDDRMAALLKDQQDMGARPK
jgi:hypothetical protein